MRRSVKAAVVQFVNHADDENAMDLLRVLDRVRPKTSTKLGRLHTALLMWEDAMNGYFKDEDDREAVGTEAQDAAREVVKDFRLGHRMGEC